MVPTSRWLWFCDCDIMLSVSTCLNVGEGKVTFPEAPQGRRQLKELFKFNVGLCVQLHIGYGLGKNTTFVIFCAFSGVDFDALN